MYSVPMPFAPVKAAAALWGTTDVLGTATSAAAIAASDAGAWALHPPPGDRHLGGVHVDPDAATSVYMDPRKVKLAAPPMPDLPDRPRTQFAPVGPAVMQALVLDKATRCVCGGGACPAPPYSLTTLLWTVRNGIRVRRALQAAGVVATTPALAAADDTTLPCLCAALGGDPDLTASLTGFASRFADTPVVTLQDPVANVAYLNDVFVREVLTNIQHQVISAAAANYARAEGNRAYVTPRPSTEEALFDPVANATATGTRVVARLLADPLSTPARRAELACATGLPLGGVGVLGAGGAPGRVVAAPGGPGTLTLAPGTALPPWSPLGPPAPGAATPAAWVAPPVTPGGGFL
jgi:hypothetical protein